MLPSSLPQRKLCHSLEKLKHKQMVNMSSKVKKRHANIPIFIPHEGCPNSCVFCNQKKISGSSGKSYRDISGEIEAALSTINPAEYDQVQIAFFGGSFTGICRDDMVALLKTAYCYVQDGRVSSIRLSTRPDYIDREILEILSQYGVKDIELGIQSMRDSVLNACKRNHTAKQTQKACRLINAYGFRLTGQMMTGLPCSTAKDERYTAKKIVKMGAVSARIYPTVVLADTQLHAMMNEGTYTPMSLDETISRSADVYEIFIDGNVKVLRVGLQSSETIRDTSQAFGETSHSALGEMCESEVYLRRILKQLKKTSKRQAIRQIIIECALGETSKASGHHATNKQKIKEYINNPKCKIVIKENEKLEKFQTNMHLL